MNNRPIIYRNKPTLQFSEAVSSVTERPNIRPVNSSATTISRSLFLEWSVIWWNKNWNNYSSSSHSTAVICFKQTRHTELHRCRIWGGGGGTFPQNSWKIFFRQISCNIWHFVNFSYIYFWAIVSCPPKLTELLCLRRTVHYMYLD